LAFAAAPPAGAQDNFRVTGKEAASNAAALELFRAAELSLRTGDFGETRRLVKILIARFPNSDWSARGQRMLDSMPGADMPPSSALADAPFVAALPSTTPEEALAHLRAAAQSGNDDQALGEAYDFLDRYPDSSAGPEVSLAAGALHMHRGEPQRALKFLLPLTQKESIARTRAIHLAGAALTSLGRDAEVLRVVPASNPETAPDRWMALAQIWRAGAFERMGRKQEAGELYRAVAASGQSSPVRAYALAAIAADWDRQGKPDRARDALTRAGKEAERWGLINLRDSLALAAATELVRGRKLEAAAQAYAEFTRKFPESPLVSQAYYERGLALKRMGRSAEAVNSFETLLQRDPNSVYAAEAHLQLGQLNTELGRTSEALSHYHKMAKASEAKDADRESILLMAQVHYNAKRWKEAIPLYRSYLKTNPEEAKTKEVQGLLLVSLWQSDHENPELMELAAKLPEHPLVAQIRWQLAASAYKRGDWAGAARFFKIQIEADPESPRNKDAAFYRAEALRQLGSAAEAVEGYRYFLHKFPRDPRATDSAMRLGTLLYQAGDFEAAASAYGAVSSKDPRGADAAYNRALALAKSQKDPAGAWENFAGRFPKHAKASWAWWEAARLREEGRQWEAAAKDYESAQGPGERAKSLYALGRLRERLKLGKRAREAYEQLKGVTPRNDPSRLAGLLRLALMLELGEKPRQAAPLYGEIVKNADPSGATYQTAKKHLDAITGDETLLLQ
jgi:tetratricopeptide (TPR) repeat protein